MKLDLETRQKITHLTQDWLKRATAMYQADLAAKNMTFPRVDVDFNQRGHIAGTARMFRDTKGNLTRGVISYNPYHITQDIDEFFYEMVPHEVAHIVASTLHGDDTKPHGPEWHAVMSRFGVKPKIYTDIVVDNVPSQKREVHLYKCIGCGSQKVLGKKEHAQADRKGLRCAKCGEPMFLDRQVTL